MPRIINQCTNAVPLPIKACGGGVIGGADRKNEKKSRVCLTPGSFFVSLNLHIPPDALDPECGEGAATINSTRCKHSHN